MVTTVVAPSDVHGRSMRIRTRPRAMHGHRGHTPVVPARLGSLRRAADQQHGRDYESSVMGRPWCAP